MAKFEKGDQIALKEAWASLSEGAKGRVESSELSFGGGRRYYVKMDADGEIYPVMEKYLRKA